MAYPIHFVGLVCLIEQTDHTFLAALPDARHAPDPRPDHSGQYLMQHSPYIILQTEDIVGTTNWQSDVADRLSFFRVDPGATLSFDHAVTPGNIDATQFKQYAYQWSILDSEFVINTRSAPTGTIATANLRRGTFRTSRLPSTDALVVHVDVQVDYGPNVVLTLTAPDNTVRAIEFPNGKQVVVANISEDFKIGTGTNTDHLDDFFIYYVLNDGAEPPSGNTPQPNRSVPETVESHRFLNRGRDLSVSCSPIKYR